MSRPNTLANPILLRFDDIERVLEQAARRGGDGYPPYNVERLAPADGRGEVLRIVLAVAGFGPDDIEVTTLDGQLVIRGRQTEEPPRTYLHRGIASRRFQRAFQLAEGVEVDGAVLRDGLLSIDLVRPLRERKPQAVTVNAPAGRPADGTSDGRSASTRTGQ